MFLVCRNLGRRILAHEISAHTIPPPPYVVQNSMRGISFDRGQCHWEHFLDIMSQKSMFTMTLSSAQRISSHRILDHIGEGGIVWAKICGPKFYGPKFYGPKFHGPKFHGPKFYGPNSYTPKTWKYSFNEIKLSSAMGISSHTIPPPLCGPKFYARKFFGPRIVSLGALISGS